MSRRKIEFFGGSFDPIHLGHLNLLVRLKEIERLDFIWICPVYCSVFKQKSPPLASGSERQKMIELAIRGLEGVGCLDTELKKKQACYTIDTLKELAEREEADYHLLLGEDTLPHFHMWKEAENLVNLAKPLVGSRGGQKFFELPPSPVKEALMAGKRSIPSMDVSSTEIRERLNKNLFCGHLVAQEVLDFIYANGLYYSSLNNS